jgi:cyclophilin family peptidyl-prolyl cis-trans isomerase
MADAALEAIDQYIAERNVDTSNARWRTSLSRPPAVTFDAGSEYFWDLETNVGNVTVKLMPDVAPRHVASTIYLTRLGFYDGLKFHRVISEFMAQGGCPLGTGTGGPGYEYGGEFSPSVKHDRPGLLSMANAGEGTDGSQFFLTFVPTPWLDGKHTIFGEVVDGMDTVEALEARGSQTGAPKEPLQINKATVRVQ